MFERKRERRCFLFKFMVAHFAFLLTSFVSYLSLRSLLPYLLHHHSSPSQPISSTLGKCYPSITLPFGRQSNPFLSWCETNTSQRTPDTSHRVQVDVCVCFHASTVSFLRPLDFSNFVCCQKSSTWPSRSPHCMIMSAFVPS
jgi:hypothetical protein